jgi:hypothetical protein
MIVYMSRKPGEAIQQAINDGRTTAHRFERVRGWWLLTVTP